MAKEKVFLLDTLLPMQATLSFQVPGIGLRLQSVEYQKWLYHANIATNSCTTVESSALAPDMIQ